MPRRNLIAFVLAVVVLALPGAGRAVDITACGQIVPAHETGVLQSDLTCPTPSLGCYECVGGNRCFPTGATCATDGDCASQHGRCLTMPAIGVDLDGTLDMNGHALVAADRIAVLCRSKGPCTVTSTVGRGSISGGSFGILMITGKLAVSNVDVHDNAAGIYTPIFGLRATLTNVSANDNSGSGIRLRDLRATDVTANGNGGYGIELSGKLSGSNITTSSNDRGGCALGKGAKLSGLSATGNGNSTQPSTGGGITVARGTLHLSGSTVTGNHFEPGDGPQAVDVITARKPKLTGTTCDHSASIDRKTGLLGPPWGVCGAD